MIYKTVTCVLALFLVQSAIAQTTATASDQNATISDANFVVVAQDIRELKDPHFRALLRARLLDLTKSSDSAERRQAAITLGSEALSDLRDNQSSINTGTVLWLDNCLTAALRKFGGADAEAMIARFGLKKDDTPSPAKDLAAAVTSMSDPAKSATARDAARAAILTGQISADGLLGYLLRVRQLNSPNLPDLLSAVLTVEERQPGFIPMRMFTFYSAVFLWETPPEIQVRYLQDVVSRTRTPLAGGPRDIATREVVNTLRAIMPATKRVAPSLYPEVVARLTSLDSAALAHEPEREAAEDRIKASSDELEALQLEAERASSVSSRRPFLARAASVALKQGKLRKAVDLEVTAFGDRPEDVSLDRFLTDVTSAALKQQQPDAAEYAISKITRPLSKAQTLLQLSKHYATIKDKEKSRVALTLGLKQLDQAKDDHDKLKVAILFAQSSIQLDSSIGYEAMRLAVDTINKLPAPGNTKQNSSYLSFLPTAGELINAYRLFGAQDEATALTLARDMKFPELRVAALLGAYSKAASKNSGIN